MTVAALSVPLHLSLAPSSGMEQFTHPINSKDSKSRKCRYLAYERVTLPIKQGTSDQVMSDFIRLRLQELLTVSEAEPLVAMHSL